MEAPKRGRGRPRKNETVLKTPKAPKEPKKPRERVVSEEQKKAMLEGRKAANERKKMKSIKSKPTILITGKERDAFDFIPLIRGAFRSQGDYLSSPGIVQRICKKDIWQDIPEIKNILSDYVELKRAKK